MRRRWLLVAAFCLLLAVLVAPKLFVVPRVSHRLCEQLEVYFGAEQVEVQLRAPWGWELLFGHIPALDVVLVNAEVDQLRIARAQFSGLDIRFEPGPLWLQRDFVYADASQLRGTLTVTEAALNEVYWREVDPERNMHITIGKDNLTLTGAVSLLGAQLSVEVHGVLEVWERTGLRLLLQNLEVEKTRVPGILLEVLNQNYDLIIDLSVLPEPAAISAVDLQQGKMLIDIGVVR